MSTKDITIQGLTVAVLQPYVAGQTITEAEAKALNQTRAENIRNNTAKLVKDALKDLAEGESPTDEVVAALKAEIAKYDAEYVFTLASVGGGRTTRDPVEAEARKIARGIVLAKLREKSIAVKDVPKEKLEERIAIVAANEAVVAQAKKVIAARSKPLNLDDIEV